jgi:hypothetical protein
VYDDLGVCKGYLLYGGQGDAFFCTVACHIQVLEILGHHEDGTGEQDEAQK